MVEVCNLMRIGRWSVLRVVSMCQLVEVTNEEDTNGTSGELCAALIGTLV